MTKTVLSAVALIAAATLIPVTAVAQHQRHTQKMNTRQAEADFKRKLDGTDVRIDFGEEEHRISADRAAVLRRQLVEIRDNMALLSRQKAFVSAAEFASFSHRWSAIETELNRRGIGRWIPVDMLVGPPEISTGERVRDVGNATTNQHR